MDLNSFLSLHPELELFESQKHNSAVLDFMAKAPMNLGSIELFYDRGPDFESLLKVQGAETFTILAPKKEGGIYGFFSMSFGKRLVHGKKESIGYLGDFRTDGSREAALIWRRLYADILKSLRQDAQFGRPELFLTAILKKNQAALQNIAVSGAKSKKLGFRYDFLQEQKMINVLFRLPWGPTCLQVERAQQSIEKELRSFLAEAESKKIFGYPYDSSNDDTWDFQKNSWPDFKIENFLVIRKGGKIVACTLPWNPGFAKRMKVQKVSGVLKIVLSLARFFGISLPAVGESIETIYLTHLCIDDAQDQKKLISEFLSFVRSSYPQVHMISFADTKGISKELKGFIFQEMPVNLYRVCLAEEELSLDFNSQDVSFEMGLV